MSAAQHPEEPLFSVIIPCCNQAGFLPQAVESLLRQGDVSLETIIINDGSSDDTRVVARRLADKYPGLSILTIEQENQGLAIARNVGIAAAAGAWIAPLDSDDIMADGFLHGLGEAMRECLPFMAGYAGGEMSPTRMRDGVPTNRFHNYSLIALVL